MVNKFRHLNRVIDRVSETIAKIVCYFVALLTLLVTYEVVMRYLFNRPTTWSMEINQFLFCYLIAFGGAYTLMTGGHVNVDVIYSHFKLRTRAIVNIITYLFVFGFLSLLLWKVSEMAIDSLKWWETTASSFNPPLFPVKVVLPIGVFLILLQSIVRFIRYIIQAITGKEEVIEKVALLELGRE